MKLPTAGADGILRRASISGAAEPRMPVSELCLGAVPMSAGPAPCACIGGQPNTGPPQDGGGPVYVYSFGSIRAVFPSLSVEKEFFQALSPVEVLPLSDALVFQVLRRTENLYLAREMCWVLQINGIDAFIVAPQTVPELLGLVAAIGPSAVNDTDFDIVVGRRGPVAGPAECNGLRLPVLACDKVYSVTRDQFVQAIVANDPKVDPALARATFDLLSGLTNNTGETDGHRAVNFLVLKYLGLYTVVADKIRDQAWSLLSVATAPSHVQGTRRILDLVFTFQNNATVAIERWFCRVDVTAEFPFLVTPMSRYYVQP